MSLPNNYKKIEYLQSNGSEWVNTGLKANTFNAIKLSFKVISTGINYEKVFGTNAEDHLEFYMNYNNATQYILGIGGGQRATISGFTNGINVVEFKTNGDILLNDVVKANYNISNETGNYDFYIFKGSDRNSHIALYSFQIWNRDNVLVRDFVPCLNDSNIAGLYDLVNDQFYTNSGTGTFLYPQYEIKGSVQPNDSGVINGLGFYDNANVEAIANVGYEFENWLLKGYTQLEYIESSRTQYIDTGVIGTPTLKTSIKFNASYFACLFGQFPNDDSKDYRLFDRQALDIYTSRQIFSNLPINEIVDIEVGNNYVFNNLTQTYIVNATPVSFTPVSNTLYVFGCNINGSLNYASALKLYEMKMWDNDVLVRDFIPVIRHSDGAIGLLDLVNLTFYGNSGSGEFIGGNIL